MFLKNKTFWILFSICLVGAIVRFVHLSNIPVSVYWDETAIGYNAYSILHTARDEYGTFMPILFRSFNDYKMGAYIYLTVLPVWIFGLTEFSVRFWSAFFGSITSVAVYFLTRSLLDVSSCNVLKSNKKLLKRNDSCIPFLAAALFAISPWSINFSRIGFEANVGAFLVVLGTTFFLQSIIRKNGYWYIWSIIVFAITSYFYRSEWVFVPLFLIALHSICWKLLQFRKILTIGIALFFILLIPLGIAIHGEKNSDRSAQVSFTQGDLSKLDYQLSVWRLQFHAVGGTVIFNRRLIRVYQLTSNYLSNLTPDYLFFSGDPEDRHGARGMGILYLIDAPFLLIGLWILIKRRDNVSQILLSWILIGIIPAAISLPNPHALRTLNMIAAYEIIIAQGIIGFLQLLTNKQLMQKLAVAIIAIAYAVCFARFLYLYFVVSPKITAYHFGDGYNQLYQYVSPMTKYKKIIISGYYWKPYIYFLFYSRYDPATYQKSGSEQGFDKYYFGETGWDSVDKAHAGLSAVNLHDIANSSDVLVALGPEEFGFQYARKAVAPAIKNIYNHDGQLMFVITRPW